MWVFLNDAFVSVVALPGQRKKLLVRGRKKGDVARALGRPKLKESHTPKADYHWRAEVPRGWVIKALTARVNAITYTNFKDSVRDDTRHDAYSGVWWEMYDWQNGRPKVEPPLPVAQPAYGPRESDPDLVSEYPDAWYWRK